MSPPATIILTSGNSVPQDTIVYSPDNRYQFAFQADGNLVLYQATNSFRRKVIFRTKTHGAGVSPRVLTLDDTGVLKIIDNTSTVIWQSIPTGTPASTPLWLMVHYQGYLLVSDSSNNVIWKSNQEPLSGSEYVKSVFEVQDSTQSTDSSSGALVVSGGIGATGNVNVGQDFKVNGSVVIEGASVLHGANEIWGSRFVNFLGDSGGGSIDFVAGPYTVAVNFGGLWTSGPVTSNRSVIYRIGRFVHMFVTGVTAPAALAAKISLQSLIPAEFRPPYDITTFKIEVWDDGVLKTGRVSVATSGALTIGLDNGTDTSLANFSGNALNGESGFETFSISWVAD